MNASDFNFTYINETVCNADRGEPEIDHFYRFILHGFLLNVIGAAGLLGNALSILVLSRPHMRSSINCLLIGLAGCDTVLILTSILLFGLTAIYPYTGYMKNYYHFVAPHIIPFVFPIALTAQTMSVYLTLTVTVERWVAVCHPFRARALCTSSRARWYVFGTAVFSLLYNIPRFFESEIYSLEDFETGEVIYCVRPAERFRNELYIKIYIHWIYLVVMYIVPFSALAALNVCIVRQVRRAQVERARLSRVQRRELSLATMLLVVVLVFFICNILPLVMNASEVFLVDDFENLNLLVRTSNLLVMVNSSVNFIIYVIFGEKFKRVFFKMFCGGRAWGFKPDSPDHTRDESSNGDHISSLRGTRRSTSSKIRSGRPPPVVYYPDHELTSLTALTPNNHSWKNGHTQNDF